MTRNQPTYGYGEGQQQTGYTHSQGSYQEQGQYPPVPTYEDVPSSASGSYNTSRQQSYGYRPEYGSNSDYYNQQQEQRPYNDRTGINYDPPRYDDGYQSHQQPAPYNNYPSPAPTAASPQPQQQPTNPNDPDRGVMGAVAGGAAGAYAGHKMHHGFLGALGGAFAGHKLEDAMKDKKKQKKQEEQVAQQHQQHNYNPPPGPPPAYSQYHQSQPQQHLDGNFSETSIDVALDRDYDLIARCRAVDGSERMSALSLNKVLGNDNGSFCWVGDGGNFAASARNVRLANGGRVLEAELKDVHGQWKHASIWLDERVGNHDGELTFV